MIPLRPDRRAAPGRRSPCIRCNAAPGWPPGWPWPCWLGVTALAALFPEVAPVRLLGRSLQMTADRSLYLSLISATMTH